MSTVVVVAVVVVLLLGSTGTVFEYRSKISLKKFF